MADVKCPLVSLVSPMGSQTRDLHQTQTRLAHSLSRALLVGLRSPCPPGAPIWLGRWTFSFCLNGDLGKQFPGGLIVEIQALATSLWVSLWSLTGPISHSGCWASDGLFESWVWLQIRKQGPPQPRYQACEEVQAKPPHKGPLWLLSLDLGSTSPSASRKMLPVWQLLEWPVLGQGTGPTPRPFLPIGDPRLQQLGLLGPVHTSQLGSLRFREVGTGQCSTLGPESGPEPSILAIFSALAISRK